MEPFCRDGSEPRSSGPSPVAAGLRPRRNAKRLDQIRPAHIECRCFEYSHRRVSERRPPGASSDLPVVPLRAASLSCRVGSPLEKQNCLHLGFACSRYGLPNLVLARLEGMYGDIPTNSSVLEFGTLSGEVRNTASHFFWRSAEHRTFAWAFTRAGRQGLAVNAGLRHPAQPPAPRPLSWTPPASGP